jgi:hypothetical protein
MLEYNRLDGYIQAGLERARLRWFRAKNYPQVEGCDLSARFGYLMPKACRGIRDRVQKNGQHHTSYQLWWMSSWTPQSLIPIPLLERFADAEA